MEVVLVPVRHHEAAELGEDAEVPERGQGALPEEQRRVPLGERPQHVLLRPCRAAPQRGLVKPGHACGGDQRLDQLDHVADGPGGCGQAGVDEAGRDPRPGHVFDQLLAALDGHVLEDKQVHDQGTQVRPDRHRRVRDAGRAGRDMLGPAPAARRKQVVLDPPGGRLRDLQLLVRPGHAQILGGGQVLAAGARPGRVMVLHLVRPRPGHRRARGSGLLAALVRRPLASPPLLPRRRLPPRQVIGGRRHRGIAAVAQQRPLKPLYPRARRNRL
jgi:hypothetical protein